MTDALGPHSQYGDFAARRGRDLVMRTPDGPSVPARLTAVTLTDPATGSFTVELHAGPDLPSSQGTFFLGDAHGDAHGEETPIFLVPSGGDADGTTFQAVFNFATPPTTAPSAQEGTHL